MICFRSGFMAAILVISAVAGSTAHAAPVQPPLTMRTLVFSAGDRDGQFVVTTQASDVVFIIPSGTKFDETELMALLDAAYKSNREVQLRFDANAPTFNAKLKEVRFPICSVALDGVRIDSGLKCPLAARKSPSALTTLALAMAHYAADDQPTAMPLLDPLIVPGALKAPWRSIALRYHAEGNQVAASDEDAWSAAADRHLLTALADWRALQLLEPDSWEPVLSTAWTLESLGDYDAAIAELARVPRKEAGDDFSATLRLASIARSRGDPAKALDLLDGLVKRHPDTGGNRYFYHRGRTLMMLGRFDQAIVSFGQGISSQPDYAFARFYRGCAHASLGQYNAALNDFEAGETNLKHLDANLYRSVKADQAYAQKLVATARERQGSGDTTPLVNLCEGFFGKIDQQRPRSPLLAR